MDKRSIEYDKGWVQFDRCTFEYEKHLNEFLDIAFSQPSVVDKIHCPCRKCNNGYYGTREEVKLHLYRWGMEETYKRWVYHGENLHATPIEEPEMNYDDAYDRNNEAAAYEMLYDMYRGENLKEIIEVESRNSDDEVLESPNEKALKFFQLLKDAEQMLYPNCDGFSKLSFIVQLFQMKCFYGWSNKSVDALLALLNKVLPPGNTCPTTIYNAQKIIRDLGLDYKKIDACRKDCILFNKEYADFNQCPKCKESRWNGDIECSNGKPTPKSSESGKKISAKTVWYFPLKLHLQRLFMSSQIALDIRWHKDKQIDDGILRHPANSLAWKTLDEQHPEFALDPRHVRLGLASDGFNPFGTMSISHSTWPVVLIPYNLPPWLCLKHPCWILSLIIPGLKSPGNGIDLFLQPLIDELKELWEVGVETFDVYKKQNFQLHAAILWTINDFLAFAILSGWSTKRALACPVCNKETSSYRLKYGHKFCYMCHHHFLEIVHEWRKDQSSFDNIIETCNPPKLLSGVDILEQYQNFEEVEFRKMTKKRKRDDDLTYNWKKKSVFFELPYWKSLLLRHNLDVMHVEKNVCDSVLGTLLNIEGKTKDNLNARLDLQVMGIKKDLHPYKIGGKLLLSAAKYSLSLEERRTFCQFLKDLKMPDSYASNIARCAHVKEGKIFGLKCHDCHVLLERLLPLAIRGLLNKDVCDTLIELSLFFSQLCSKTLNIDTLEHLESHIAIILCKMEMIFPPSLFDIMVHLPTHLATEAKIGGPVQYR